MEICVTLLGLVGSWLSGKQWADGAGFIHLLPLIALVLLVVRLVR